MAPKPPAWELLLGLPLRARIKALFTGRVIVVLTLRKGEPAVIGFKV